MAEWHVFEVTAAGFSGGSDATDDRVFWVLCHDRAQLDDCVQGTGAKVWGEVKTAHVRADSTLPADRAFLRQALTQFHNP